MRLAVLHVLVTYSDLIDAGENSSNQRNHRFAHMPWRLAADAVKRMTAVDVIDVFPLCHSLALGSELASLQA